MRLSIALIIFGFIPTTASSQQQLSGTWQGYWSRAGDSMPITLVVKTDPTTSKHSASFTSDRLRVSGIPFNDIRLQGCCDLTLLLRGDRTTLEFTGRLNGDSLSGAFREGESGGQFGYSRVVAGGPLFEEREITFTSGGVKLAGSVLLPATGNSLPAVVFLHGSGGEGRWASRYVAAKLASRGIAALIFDKRGVGGSSGDWRTATLEDLAADGAAAVARLREEPRIDPRRIGIHGHSQGGTLAPLVVARSSRVAFVVGSAAAGVPTDSTEIFSVLNSVYPQAKSARDSADARAFTNELVAAAYHGGPRARIDSLAAALGDRPWFFAPPAPNAAYWTLSREFGQYNALVWWAKVRVPVLLIYGAEDQRVAAAENAARISATLRNAGNADVTVRIFPGADHTFRMPPGAGGWPVTAPDYLPTVLEWLAKR